MVQHRVDYSIVHTYKSTTGLHDKKTSNEFFSTGGFVIYLPPREDFQEKGWYKYHIRREKKRDTLILMWPLVSHFFKNSRYCKNGLIYFAEIYRKRREFGKMTKLGAKTKFREISRHLKNQRRSIRDLRISMSIYLRTLQTSQQQANPLDISSCIANAKFLNMKSCKCQLLKQKHQIYSVKTNYFIT